MTHEPTDAPVCYEQAGTEIHTDHNESDSSADEQCHAGRISTVLEESGHTRQVEIGR